MKKITKWWTELKPEVKQKWEIGLFTGGMVIVFTISVLIISYLSN
jgi:hypothetical protein